MKPVLALISVVISFLVACGPSVNGGSDDDDDDDGSSSGVDANPADCVNTPEICGGGGDEDCDGLTDCDDADCEGQSGCSNCGEIEHPEASLALPDGDMKVSYSSSISFTEFGTGPLMDINHFRGVCVTMEHSWIRDLAITLTCPSGREIVLHNFAGRTDFSEVYAGTPDDTDDIDPVPGTGAEYCWTPTATNGTWLEYASSHASPLGTLTLPAGDYRSFTPMTDLLGCTLNGNWTLKVTDDWPQDNGFIFSWGLRFDPSIVVDCTSWPPIG